MLLLLFFSLLSGFSSVDSCSTVSISGVTLTGVCPNDTFTVPIGTTLSYECTTNSAFFFYWNVSGTLVTPNNKDNFDLAGIVDVVGINPKSTLTVVTTAIKPVLVINSVWIMSSNRGY